MEEFKKRSLEERKTESSRILTQYPERNCVIVGKAKNSDVQEIEKCKYLVPRDLTIGQFVFVLRKRIKLSPEQAIFIFCKQWNFTKYLILNEYSI